MNILERPCVMVFGNGAHLECPPEKASWNEQSRKSMWRTSPGGGCASGGMVAHDLVNGCQAAARRDERSEPLQRHHPRRGLFCTWKSLGRPVSACVLKRFLRTSLLFSDLLCAENVLNCTNSSLTVCREIVDIVKRVGRQCGGTTPARARWLWSVNQ